MADAISKRFDKLEALIEKGFASVADEFERVDAQHDAIKDELRAIRMELAHINRRLDALEEQVGDMRGYSKEIDELRSRIKNIERHLRLKAA